MLTVDLEQVPQESEVASQGNIQPCSAEVARYSQSRLIPASIKRQLRDSLTLGWVSFNHRRFWLVIPGFEYTVSAICEGEHVLF